jgi:type IV pilus assembly protein PilE
MRNNMRGITLIELMVVVVIIAIIASVAVPSYRSYLVRSHRTEATTALLQIRSAQERFFLQNGQYATGGQLTTAPPGGLGILAQTPGGHYTVSVNRPTPTTFTATAVPRDGQATDDPQCQQLAISESGNRTSSPGDIAHCWR